MFSEKNIKYRRDHIPKTKVDGKYKFFWLELLVLVTTEYLNQTSLLVQRKGVPTKTSNHIWLALKNRTDGEVETMLIGTEVMCLKKGSKYR